MRLPAIIILERHHGEIPQRELMLFIAERNARRAVAMCAASTFAATSYLERVQEVGRRRRKALRK